MLQARSAFRSPRPPAHSRGRRSAARPGRWPSVPAGWRRGRPGSQRCPGGGRRHDLCRGRRRRASRPRKPVRFHRLDGRFAARTGSSVVCLVAQRMDRDFLQRTLGADQLQEGAGGLGVLGDIGIQPARQGARTSPGQRSGAASPRPTGIRCSAPLMPAAGRPADPGRSAPACWSARSGQPDDGGRVVALDALHQGDAQAFRLGAACGIVGSSARR